jgi:hypothetical protein
LLGLLKSRLKPPSPRLARLLEKLSAHSFSIGYVKGEKLQIADTLSRWFDKSHEYPANQPIAFLDIQKQDIPEILNYIEQPEDENQNTYPHSDLDPMWEYPKSNKIDTPKTTLAVTLQPMITRSMARRAHIAIPEIGGKTNTNKLNKNKNIENTNIPDDITKPTETSAELPPQDINQETLTPDMSKTDNTTSPIENQTHQTEEPRNTTQTPVLRLRGRSNIKQADPFIMENTETISREAQLMSDTDNHTLDLIGALRQRDELPPNDPMTYIEAHRAEMNQEGQIEVEDIFTQNLPKEKRQKCQNII